MGQDRFNSQNLVKRRKKIKECDISYFFRYFSTYVVRHRKNTRQKKPISHSLKTRYNDIVVTNSLYYQCLKSDYANDEQA